MSISKELASVAESLKAVAQLLEDELIDPKSAAGVIRNVLKSIE